MPLTGEARTKYMREYMRRRRAAERSGGPVKPVKPHAETATGTLARELAAAKARIGELEAALARAQASNRELKAALEAAKNPTQATPVVRKGYTQAEFDLVLAMLRRNADRMT